MRKQLVNSILVLIVTVIAVGASFNPISANPSLTQTGQEWINPNANVIPWAAAGLYAGQARTVQGTIVYISVSTEGNVFLEFNNPSQGYFYAVIFSKNVGNFRCSPANFYLNREVRITGYIQFYIGSPEINVSNPSQIEVAYIGFGCSLLLPVLPFPYHNRK